MTTITVAVDDADDVLDDLQYVDAEKATDTAVRIQLDRESGDYAFERADGIVTVVQDALTASIPNASIASVDTQE